jgi:hypothetical protein
MRNLNYITNDLAVLEDTIIKHWDTTDYNAEGYQLENGTDRKLCEGQTEDGEWILFAETNGNPVVLFEGEGEGFVKLMTNANGDQTDEEVTNLILDAIQNSELKEWAKGELCA